MSKLEKGSGRYPYLDCNYLKTIYFFAPTSVLYFWNILQFFVNLCFYQKFWSFICNQICNHYMVVSKTNYSWCLLRASSTMMPLALPLAGSSLSDNSCNHHHAALAWVYCSTLQSGLNYNSSGYRLRQCWRPQT